MPDVIRAVIDQYGDQRADEGRSLELQQMELSQSSTATEPARATLDKGELTWNYHDNNPMAIPRKTPPSLAATASLQGEKA